MELVPSRLSQESSSKGRLSLLTLCWPLLGPTSHLGHDLVQFAQRKRTEELLFNPALFRITLAGANQCHVEEAPLLVGWRRRRAGAREFPAASSQCHPITTAKSHLTGMSSFSPSIVQNSSIRGRRLQSLCEWKSSNKNWNPLLSYSQLRLVVLKRSTSSRTISPENCRSQHSTALYNV